MYLIKCAFYDSNILSFFSCSGSLYVWSQTYQYLLSLNPWQDTIELVNVNITNLLSLHAVHSSIQRQGIVLISSHAYLICVS